MEGLEGQLREVRGRVEQRRAETSSQASQGAVVKALMEARRRGEIEGIHGRLGGLVGGGPWGLGWLGAGLQLRLLGWAELPWGMARAGVVPAVVPARMPAPLPLPLPRCPPLICPKTLHPPPAPHLSPGRRRPGRHCP